jgi:hypothetical protein
MGDIQDEVRRDNQEAAAIAFPKGVFLIDADRGAVVHRRSDSGKEVTWAMCFTGEGWHERAKIICGLLNRNIGVDVPDPNS